MPKRFHTVDDAIKCYTKPGLEHDIWTGPVMNNLPYVTVNYMRYSVARYIYCKDHNLVEESYDMVWNTCGVLYCVKPEHLAMHESHAQKIKVSTTEICFEFWRMNISGAALARKYGVSRQRIHQIVHGENNA